MRTASDRCPTAIALHPAADGLIARVRLPGGRLTAAQAWLLADWGNDLPRGLAGAERIEITGRGNLQIRGLDAAQSGPLAASLFGAGLLPSEPHDQARTIVASPLAGRLPGAAGVDELVTQIDAALCAEPALTELSGRFLIAVDDGLGAADPLAADLALVRRAPGGLSAALDEQVTVLVGGVVAGTAPLADAAAALIQAAVAFVAAADGAAWRIRELPDKGEGLITELRARGVVTAPAGRPAVLPTPALPPLGLGRQSDGRRFVRALAPLGRLSYEQFAAAAGLAASAGTELRLATDRSLTLPDLPERHAQATLDGLGAAGLITADADPGVGLTACAGLGCATSNGDVRAAAALRRSARRPGAPREHLVGCDRRCGAPAAGLTVVLQPGDTPDVFAARAGAALEAHL